MYKILKNIIEMDDYSVQKLSKSQPPEPFEWNTVEGTELNVSDCIGGNGKIEVKGNTYQKQLSGKNLLDFSKWKSKEVNGVRWTNNGDGTVTANGTATDNSDFYVIKDYSTKYTGDYTISGCPSGGSATTYYVLQDIRNKSDFGNGVTKSFNNESFAVRLRIMKGYTANGILFRPMIELGTTKTDFESYCGGQPSPNPDYPQEIKVVTGDNVVKQTGKNKFCAELSSLWYASETGKFFNSSNYTSLICRVEPNTEYTISKKNMSNRFVLITSETKPQHASTFLRILIAATNSPRTQFTFTTTSNEKYIFFGVYSGSNETEIAKAIEEIQLEEGSNPTQYEPYKEKDYNLNLGTIELCKIDNYQDTIFKNVVGDENYNAELENEAWYKKKVIDKYVLNGAMYFANTGVTNVFYTPIITNYSRINNKPFCDNFKGFNNVDTASSVTIINSVAFNKTYNYNRFYISFNGTIDELKDFLNEKMPTLYYANDNTAYEKITEPTLISQLEALKKAKWFKGVNHIWTETDNLEPVLEGTYKQSIQSETQNSIANLQVQANEQNTSNTPESEV